MNMETGIPGWKNPALERNAHELLAQLLNSLTFAQMLDLGEELYTDQETERPAGIDFAMLLHRWAQRHSPLGERRSGT